MSGESKRKGILAFALQSALFSPASVAQYAMPKGPGGIKPVQERGDLPLTRQNASRAGQHVKGVHGEGTITLLATPDEFGMLAYAALGEQDTTGVSAPYEHVFTLADAYPEPLTLWDLVGDDWWRFEDTFISKFVIKGESQDDVWLDVSFLSFKPSRVGPTLGFELPALTESEPRYKFIGATVELEANSATPSQVKNAQKTILTIDRKPATKFGSSLTPTLIIPEREVDFDANIVYDSDDMGWDWLAGAYLESVAASGEVSQGFLKGSFHVTMGRHPDDATRLMEFYSGPPVGSHAAPYAQNWEYKPDRADSDPGGGPLEMEANGIVADPGDAESEVTLVIRNEVADDYSSSVPSPPA